MAASKARVLIIGTGGVGTMAAYALESGGKARVTAVMRSNYAAVQKNGISIDSMEHGHNIRGWRPSESTYNRLPTAKSYGTHITYPPSLAS